jgi:hypothetical protein
VTVTDQVKDTSGKTYPVLEGEKVVLKEMAAEVTAGIVAFSSAETVDTRLLIPGERPILF